MILIVIFLSKITELLNKMFKKNHELSSPTQQAGKRTGSSIQRK